MKTIFSTCLILFFFHTTRAQHCPYDGTSLIVVKVTKEDGYGIDKRSIQISIRDVYGNTIYRKAFPDIFVQNPKQTNPSRDTYDHQEISFAFAENNFILSFPDYLINEYEEKGGLYIYVNPLDGEYNPIIRRLTKKDLYSIHYINSYVPFGSSYTESVPENKETPFAPFLIKFLLTKQQKAN